MDMYRAVFLSGAVATSYKILQFSCDRFATPVRFVVAWVISVFSCLRALSFLAYVRSAVVVSRLSRVKSCVEHWLLSRWHWRSLDVRMEGKTASWAAR